ncbi:MAG: hypothetical protein K8T91_24880 [Planctomycetes bacterium]|nr:hypothetical protein [Planctomycetota bacterium]
MALWSYSQGNKRLDRVDRMYEGLLSLKPDASLASYLVAGDAFAFRERFGEALRILWECSAYSWWGRNKCYRVRYPSLRGYSDNRGPVMVMDVDGKGYDFSVPREDDTIGFGLITANDQHYRDLDPFDRVLGARWKLLHFRKLVHSARGEIYEYGYDRLGHKLLRANRSFDGNTRASRLDEAYARDRLERTIGFDRGDFIGKFVQNGKGILLPAPEIQNRQFAQSWDLDEVGNSLTLREDADGNGQFETVQKRTFNSYNEIKSISGSVTPRYDDAGNMTVVPKPQTQGQYFQCAYDAWNRMVSVSDGETGRKVAEYGYDGLGRRNLKRTFGQDAANALQEERQFLYSKDGKLLQERTKQQYFSTIHGRNVWAFLPDKEYVWGPRGSNDLFLRGERFGSNPPQDKRLYALTDAEHNVTAVMREPKSGPIQDTPAFEVEERFIYDPQGRCNVLSPNFSTLHPENPTQSDADWHHRLAGYYFDAETGLYYSPEHVYHPTLGVALQEDVADTDLMGAMASPLLQEASEALIQAIDAELARPPVLRPAIERYRGPFTWVDSIDRFFAGFADVVTFGGTTKVREWAFGEIASRNHEGVAFHVGQGAGMVWGLALGYGVGSAVSTARTGWAFNMARGYIVAGDVHAVGMSSYHAATGQFTMWDTLGFLPAIGWGMGVMRTTRGGRPASAGLHALEESVDSPISDITLGSEPGSFTHATTTYLRGEERTGIHALIPGIVQPRYRVKINIPINVRQNAEVYARHLSHELQHATDFLTKPNLAYLATKSRIFGAGFASYFWEFRAYHKSHGLLRALTDRKMIMRSVRTARFEGVIANRHLLVYRDLWYTGIGLGLVAATDYLSTRR